MSAPSTQRPAPSALSMTGYMTAHPALKYVFFGGKGGVGKSTVAVNLALAMRAAGWRIVWRVANEHGVRGTGT